LENGNQIGGDIMNREQFKQMRMAAEDSGFFVEQIFDDYMIVSDLSNELLRYKVTINNQGYNEYESLTVKQESSLNDAANNALLEKSKSRVLIEFIFDDNTEAAAEFLKIVSMSFDIFKSNNPEFELNYIVL
jgi:hypothetical protein